MLPDKAELVQECAIAEADGHAVRLDGLGNFRETPNGDRNRLMIELRRAFIAKSGLKTVPFEIVSIGGRGFAEGIGETRFWLDATRPVTSAIWEKRAGTEFPAIQEMRFHFFYTFEAMPDRVFRSMTPARMRSDNVAAFPPPPGTVYRLAAPVKLEDVSNPGVAVGTVLANRAVVPKPGPLGTELLIN